MSNYMNLTKCKQNALLHNLNILKFGKKTLNKIAFLNLGAKSRLAEFCCHEDPKQACSRPSPQNDQYRTQKLQINL